jgi:RNA polymerase sigma-70 factor (ECF subfamily)
MVLTSVSPLEDFDSVVRLHQQAVFRFILASLRDRDAAETLTQECLLRAYKARMQFRGESAVKTWLMRIAVNLVRDHQSSVRLRFWRRPHLDVSAIAQTVADRQKSPEAAASARQQIAAVWEAAAGLSHRQRTVLLLRFVEDMEILEIVEATGMAEGTVKAHLFRALENVRRKLERL